MKHVDPSDLVERARALRPVMEDMLAATDSGDASRIVEAAECIRYFLAPDPVEPVALRRTMLRRIWRRFHPGVKRTPVADLIYLEWVGVVAEGGDPLPGTKADAYAALGRAGVAPVAVRTIIDDLDAELHPL